MGKYIGLFLSLILVSLSSVAFEPELDQQGMVYFNLTFDAGHSTKTDHDFGFRFDRTYTSHDQVITMNQLNSKPAVFDIKLNNYGLKSFVLNGIDYVYKDYAVYGAEGGKTKNGSSGKTAAETTEAKSTEVEAAQEPVEESRLAKAIDEIPLGVLVGAVIGIVAIGSSGD